jgi:hypothetical protein
MIHVIPAADRQEFVAVFNQQITEGKISGYNLEEGNVITKIAHGALMPITEFLPTGQTLPIDFQVARAAIRITIVPLPH